MLALVAALSLTGCATADLPLDKDVTAFTAGIDPLLKAGMPFKEAEKIIRDRFPKPLARSEAAPLIGRSGDAGRNRRFTWMWATNDPGTKLVLTIECDRGMHVARWSTGPFFETR